MNYYEVAILNTPNIFTYQAVEGYKKGDVVEVEVKSKKNLELLLKKLKSLHLIVKILSKKFMNSMISI